MKTFAKNLPQYIIIACGAISVGICLGWTSKTEEDILIQYDFILTENEFAWVGSLFTLGIACFCIPMEFLINAMGRKYSILLLVLPFTIGWGLLALPQNAVMMYIGRFILGIAAGGYFIGIPVYTNEISPIEIRGNLGLVFQVMMTFGILLAFIFGWILRSFNTTLISVAFPILLSLIFVFMPESPTYLIRKGKIEEATKSLQLLRGKQYDCSQELKTIQTESDKFAKKKLGCIDTLTKTIGEKALPIILGLMIFQQLSGAYAIIFYTESILKYSIALLSSYFSTVLVGVILFLATLLSSVFVVHRCRRRILLLISGIFMAICTALDGYYFYRLFNGQSIESIEYLPHISLGIFVIAFSLGYGPVPWILMNEIFPTEVRGVAFAMAGTFQWVLAFIVTKSFLNVNDDSYNQSHSFWIFSAFTIMSCIFVVVCLPETRGKSLPEVQQLFGIKTLE